MAFNPIRIVHNYYGKPILQYIYKINVFPVYKKGDEQWINNDQPVSLFPICATVFEKGLFNSLFKYLDTNNQLNNNQSGFHPGESRMHQLLPIIHIIYKAFEANTLLEVRGIFQEIFLFF